jgi:hypothetical protein
MGLPAIERMVVTALSLMAVLVCTYVVVRVVPRRDLPTSLRRIEIEWTLVSLGILLAALAATAL